MRTYWILLLAVGLPLSACDDPTGTPDPSSPGTLVVSITTEGEDPDPDGYLLTVDDADTLDLEPTGTAELDLPPGRHNLRLLDVAEQCAIAPGPTLELDVPGGRRTAAAFEVNCPATRARVTVETSGLQPDPDGYRLSIDDLDSVELSPTATVEVELPPGRHSLRLLDVSVRCSVDPGTEVEVDVPAGSTVPVAFEVTCNTGAGVTVRTTGLDFDRDGYRLVVDDSDRGSIGVNLDDPRLIGLDPGTYTIGLTALAPNCAFDGPGSRTVTVVAAEVAPVEFTVVCNATTGVIGVDVQGSATWEQFVAVVDGEARLNVRPARRLWYLVGVAAGAHTVSLSGPDHCSVESDSQTVTVRAGTPIRDTVEVTFAVTCTSGVRIITHTTGAIPQGRYRVLMSGPNYYDSCDLPIVASGTIAPNDSLLLQVAAGTYWTCLGNVPGNCVTPPNSPGRIQLIHVAGRGVVDVEFNLACS